MMTSAQVVKTSVNITSNSPSQDYTHPNNHNLPNYVLIKYVSYNKFIYFSMSSLSPVWLQVGIQDDGLKIQTGWFVTSLWRHDTP